MNRAAVIFITGFLIIAAVMASLAATVYLSWRNAQEDERDKLFGISKITIQRTLNCFDRVYQTLNQLEKVQSTPCSEEHLKEMRTIAFNNSYVSDIEYLENSIVKCSTNGLDSSILSIPTTGFIMPNGVVVAVNISPLNKLWRKFIGLRLNNYNVLVDSRRLTDLAIDSYLKVAIVSDNGQVLSSLNTPDPKLIELALKNSNIKSTAKELVAVSKIPDMNIIVSESKSYVRKKWRKELLIIMPFGLIMALTAMGGILYFSRRRLSLYGELKIAITRKEFINHYQPIIDYKTNTCVGAEALVRWQRPDGKLIRPDLFIPVAEETGLILPITDQVLQLIVKDLKPYFLANKNFHVAINVDVNDFNSGRIFSELERVLADTGIERHQIWLEITERGLMDIVTSKDKITRARESGYVIVIDDFGTGYSSLAYLKNLPLDVLKIDKSFINTVATDSVTSNVTYHIINIAKSLNLKIVAEGIELHEQAKYLQDHDVDYAQGWLYAKAMPIDEFIAFYNLTNKKVNG